MTDPRLPVGSGFCLCSSCGEYFVNDRAFERHRIAVPGIRSFAACIPVEALIRKGFQKLELKNNWYWTGG